MTYQPPMPPPTRRGFSGPAVALIAVLALGAGCVGGVAIGSVGSTPTTVAPPTQTVAAEAPRDTALPPAEEEKGRLVKLPDFKGQNAAIARQWLVDRGWNEFSDIKLGSQDRYETMVLLPENWTVTKQSHKAGSKVKIGTTIVLPARRPRDGLTHPVRQHDHVTPCRHWRPFHVHRAEHRCPTARLVETSTSGYKFLKP